MALTLVAVVAIGLAPRAAAHRQTSNAQSKLPPVILPTYYDGIETQTVDQSVHPEDPANTYRIVTHYSACQQFGGPSDPSQRVNLTDAELAADGLMPRNAFASIEDWDRSVLNAGVRVCDTYALFNDSDGSSADINGVVTTPRAGPWLRQQPQALLQPKTPDNNYDCYCTNMFWTTQGPGLTEAGYAGYIGDGLAPGVSHVAEYSYSWVPTLTAGPGTVPDVSSESVWVGASGMFHQGKEILQQAGIQNWYSNTNGESSDVFWECVDPVTHSPLCNGAQQLLSAYIISPGDEITMYISGNYHWVEDDTIGSSAVDSGNIGPVPVLDSSEWITEAPNGYTGSYNSGNGGVYPLADYGNTGQSDMEWMNQNNWWWDAGQGDNDYINYEDVESSSLSNVIEVPGTVNPYWINSTWRYGQAVFWYRRN
jgi:hypothetical protein